MGLLSINWATVIINVANVLIFFGLIKHFFWDRIMGIMEKRQQLINADLEQAKVQNEEAEQLKKQYEESLTDAKEEAAGIIENARKRSKEEHDAAVKQTTQEAEKMLADAQKTIEAERSKAMQGVQAEIAGIAMAAAQKVIGNNIDEEANRKYLDDFLSEAGGKK